MSDILKSSEVISNHLLFGKPLSERLNDLHTDLVENRLIDEKTKALLSNSDWEDNKEKNEIKY